MAELDPNSFDPTRPALFYCKHEELVALADAAMVVEGVELPVHRVTLSQHSSVFRAAYAAEEQAAPGQASDADGTRAQKRCKVVTSAGFEGFSLRDVALFLRLVYNPADATFTNLARLGGSLLSVARLAHKFDAQLLLAAVEQHLADSVDGIDSSSTLAEVAERLQLAEELHMDRLLAAGARDAARLLLSSLPQSNARFVSINSLSAVAQLQDMSLHASRLVLGALLASLAQAGRAKRETLASWLTSLDTVAGWGGLQLRFHGELTWEVALPDFNSGQEVLTSPQFTAGGLPWVLDLYPRGDGEAAAGYVSLYLRLAGTGSMPTSAGMMVAYSLELLNIYDIDSVRAANIGVLNEIRRCGWQMFAPVNLGPGGTDNFLHDGKLRLRARET